MIIMSSTLLIGKLMKMRECVYIRYTPERLCKYDVRFNCGICSVKVPIVIKVIGVHSYLILRILVQWHISIQYASRVLDIITHGRWALLSTCKKIMTSASVVSSVFLAVLMLLHFSRWTFQLRNMYISGSRSHTNYSTRDY